MGNRIRYVLTGTLEVLSPMHVGTGEVRTIEALKHRKPGSNAPETSEAATIARDHACNPYLPGTTLKGLLRRICEEDDRLDAAAVKALFGEIKNDDGSGVMGALLVRGAALVAPGNAAGMPYAGAPEIGPGVFIAARTRIDRKRGVAEHNHLYFQEMVAPGARLSLALLLEHRRRAKEDSNQFRQRAMTDLTCLVQVLSRLAEVQGHAIGKGQAEGQGRIQLDPGTAHLAEAVIGPDGYWMFEDQSHLWSGRAVDPAAEAGEEIHLTCEGPFLVADSSFEPKRTRDGEPIGPQVSAQRRGGQPLILGSSVLGVLRARAAWLAAVAASRDGRDPEPREIDNPGQMLAQGESVAGLTPLERLFGVTGFRGLIALHSLTVEGGRTAGFTSVKLDRFSGAPIDNALFTTEAFIGTNLRFILSLTTRGAWPSEDDKKRFAILVKDIKTNGMVLGHGGNTGFGWFAPPEPTEGEHAA